MKRFTETTKWIQNVWFLKLESKYKMFWLYLLDSCDSVGVWEETLFIAEILLKESYPLEETLEVFKEHILVFEPHKWWIKKFCVFQYGELSEKAEKNRPHQSYVRLLKKHGLWNEYLLTLDDFTKRYNKKRTPILLRERIILFDDYTCIYCSKKQPWSNIEIDHIIPESIGGSQNIINLVTSCKDCNVRKAEYTVEEFCKRNNYSLSEISHRLSERLQRLKETDINIEQDTEKETQGVSGIDSKKKIMKIKQ